MAGNKYAMYLRKSRADLDAEAMGQGETLARHQRQLTELAERQGYEIGGIYREIRSGDSIDARPEMLRLLSDVENRRWAGVLCMDIDRLARGDSADQGRITRTFSLSDTLIITPGRVYDMADDDDEEYADFGLFIARKEYKTTRRRMMRGRIASVREGHFVGSTPPYGYDKVRVEKGRGFTLAPNAESGVVRLMFSLCLSGEGCTAIARRLDVFGAIPRGGGKWSRATVADILRNPVYCGKIRWQYRREKRRSAGGKITKRREVTGEYILAQGLHPAIVSEDEFVRAQEMINSRRRASVNTDKSLKNPLAGLIYCGKCGSLMQRICGRNEARLACPNRGCGNVSSKLSSVEDAVTAALSGWMDMTVEASPTENTKPRAAEYSAEMLRARLHKLSGQRDNIYTFFEQGIYDAEEFRSRLGSLDKRLDALRGMISCAEEEQCEQPAAGDIVCRKTVSEIYRGATAEERNRLLHTLLWRVEYTKETRGVKGSGVEDFNLAIIVKFPKNHGEMG